MRILLVALLFSSLFADVYTLYKNKNYPKACKVGSYMLYKKPALKKDDNYQSVVALACVKADMLNAAIKIAKTLTHTKIGRNNASYVASLFLIKKLLLQLVHDKIDIANLSLPKSPHFLSIVFENISHGNFTKQGDTYVVDKKYFLKPYQQDKFMITIRDNNSSQTHIFW
ncbi:MAG: hypothetical protein GXO40_06500 [Epsilonproteobacteria bacterium]|nr:hypothetical protein [Campylobacterota bacterium]